MTAVSGDSAPFLYLAPLKGITDALYRRVFCKHFGGLDSCIAPFINPQSSSSPCSDKLLSDLLPEHNNDLPLIPQILNTDAGGFLSIAERLWELGYREINWNLGCPVKMVAGKNRGSGLLPYPDRITALLDAVIPRLQAGLSIKMRLGYKDCSEARELLPRLNDYPLTEIIIHPRLGIQLYRGRTLPEEFQVCSNLTRHKLVYNGDITSISDYIRLADQFPEVNRWMLGRGLVANPLLAQEIKGYSVSDQKRREMLSTFHEELFDAMKQRLSGPGHLLGKMKQIWIYFIGSFPGKERMLKKITRAGNEQAYLAAVKAVMEE